LALGCIIVRSIWGWYPNICRKTALVWQEVN